MRRDGMLLPPLQFKLLTEHIPTPRSRPFKQRRRPVIARHRG